MIPDRGHGKRAIGRLWPWGIVRSPFQLATISGLPAALALLALFLFDGAAAQSPVGDHRIIGLALSPHGPRAALSDALRSSIEPVVAGSAGRSTLRIETDGCTAAGGVEAARRLVAAGARLVVGHPCSNAALAAAKVYAAAGIPFVAAGVRHADLTDKRAGPLVFRLGGRDDHQIADTVTELAERIRGRRLAIVHDRTRYQRRLADGVARGLGTIASSIQTFPIVAGEKGYEPIVAAFKVRPPDVIYLALFATEARVISAALRRSGLKRPIVLAETAASSKEDLGNYSGGDDVLWVAPANVNAEIAATAAEIVTTFQALGADEPNGGFAGLFKATASGEIALASFRAVSP